MDYVESEFDEEDFGRFEPIINEDDFEDYY